MLRSSRQALRSLGRAPGLAITSIVTVALGVGAGTALFSVVKAVLLNPLPYSHPERLAWLAEVNDSGFDIRIALRNFQDWHDQNHSFSALASYGDGPIVAGGGTSPERTYGAAVTGDFFRVLAVQPLMGRTFSAAEQKPGAAVTALIGHGLWQRAYGADPHILGRTIRVVGMQATVIGVMPLGFSFPPGSELWVSETALNDNDSRTSHNDWAIGRLRPGVTLDQARQDLSLIARRLKQQYPNPFQAKDASTVSLDSHIVGQVRPALLMLFGAVGFLLLIVCVNVANLFLVRITTRSRELALRTALGAPLWRLLRDLMTETLILALAGGGLGLLAASWSIDLLRVVLPSNLPRIADVQIDSGVIAFAIALSAAAGLLAGALPAWRASRLNLNEALKSGSRSQTAGRRSRSVQGSLVISEVALSLVLLVGAGMLLRSFWNLRAIDPGFRADHVLIGRLAFSDLEAAQRDRVVSVYRDILQQVRLLPGVQSASMIQDLPLDPIQRDGHFSLQGEPNLPGNADAAYRVISPGYFRAMRISLVRGRDFTEADTTDAPGAAIIDEAMEREFFHGRDPIGRRIWFDSFETKEHWLAIVGVAKSVHQSSLTAPANPAVYVCYTQGGYLLGSQLVIRSGNDPASLAHAVRSRVQSINRETAVQFETMDQVLDAALAGPRFQMRVLLAFAMLALLLAAVGLYGVLSYAVTSHQAEIGIRMALGAQPGEVFRMISGWAVRLTLIGVALGLVGCLALHRVFASLVYGIGPAEPAPLMFAAAVLLAMALAASSWPARRAMRVDPIAALRQE